MKRSMLGLICLLGTSVAVLSGQHWNEPVAIGGGWNNQDMVFDAGGGAYLVWMGTNFSRSTDGGRTWSSPIPVPHPAGHTGNPDIAIDAAGTLYVVAEFKPAGESLYRVMFTRSTDGGNTWSTPQVIGTTPKHTAWPTIEVDALGRIHVLWQDKCNLHNWNDPPLPDCTTEEYYHVLSADGGTTWSGPALVASGGGGWTVQSAVDGAGAFYGLWSFGPDAAARGAYLFKTADGGATWSRTFLGDGNETAIAVDGDDTVHVLFARWTGPDTRTIFHRRGEVGGTVWAAAEPVGTSSGQSNWNPSSWCAIAADRNSHNVLAAWQDGSSGNFEVYARRSPNRGRTWLKAENISATAERSLQPEVFFDRASGAHLVWNEGPDVYYRRGPFRGR